MPAIQLERLYRQATELAEWYHQPEKFATGLRDLFEFYADRTHRRGTSGAPALAIKTYKIAQPVMRRVLHELDTPLKADPQAALPLVDALWVREIYEFRVMAIEIISRLPVSLAAPVFERIQEWSRDNREEKLLSLLAERGMAALREQDIDDFLVHVRGWCQGDNFLDRRLGLLALLPLVKDGDFTNLPLIYGILTPLLDDLPKTLRADLLPVLRPLVRRSPKETAFFLRQRLEEAAQPGEVTWMIRRLLEDFPADQRASLRGEINKSG
jgi:hypothetical protein